MTGRLPLRLFRWVVLLAALATMGETAPARTARPFEMQVQARRTLEAAAAAGARAAELPRLLTTAAESFETLGQAEGLPADLRKDVAAAAVRLRAQATAPAGAAFATGEYLRLLERVAAHLLSRDASFQGSYTESKVVEPAYGGHASASGPPPPLPAAPAMRSPVTFEAVPAFSEKTFCGGPAKDHILESGGSGLALLDYDGDGRLDVYVVSAEELDGERRRIPHPSALYRNQGGLRFANVAPAAGVAAATWGNGVCAGDFDDDGRLDLYVTNYGANALFKNDGRGGFTEVAAAAGVAGGGWSTGCAFFDGNGDGRLDLYVARYATVSWDDVVNARRTLVWRGGPKVMTGPVGIPGAADVYYENLGGGRFAEKTAAAGLADTAAAYGFGVVATDTDDDGRLDLYVANDSNPNFLYRGHGQGRFESAGLLGGVALNEESRAQAGMGVDAGDYDNDGRMDLVVTNFAQDTNTLYRNLGNGSFADVTQAAGLGAATFERMGWGVAFADVDLDGRLDLLVANGHIYPQVDAAPALKETFRQKSQLFVNDGRGFRDVSETAGGGLQTARPSRGLAVGDLDNDGDLDVVLSNMDDVPTLLENRQTTGHHWAGFQLSKKEGPNRFAVGARVTIAAGGRRQVREVRSGGSYLSQNDLRVLFGLGTHPGPVDVEVRLGDERWEWRGLPVDRYATLVLGADNRVAAPAAPAPAAAAAQDPPAGDVKPALAARLAELSALLRDCTCRAREAADLLLAADFKGGRLVPAQEEPAGRDGDREVFRGSGLTAGAPYRGSAFRKELTALVADFGSVSVADLEITAVEREAATPEPSVTTSVRFDLAGPGKAGAHAQRSGHWRIRWRRAPDGAWRVIEWVTLDHVRTQAP